MHNKTAILKDLRKEAENLFVEIREIASKLLLIKNSEVFMALCRTKAEKLAKLNAVKYKMKNIMHGRPMLGESDDINKIPPSCAR